MQRFPERHPRLVRLAGEVGRFGSVGAVAYVVQLGVTNLLWAVSDLSVMTGQVVGTVCSIAVAFVGNRFWTFRSRARTGYGRETALFLVMNGIGLLIQLGCQAFSLYVLGLDGPLAQNIAGNVVGVGLGTVFRFFSYRTWVFPERTDRAGAPEPQGGTGTDAGTGESRSPGPDEDGGKSPDGDRGADPSGDEPSGGPAGG